MNMKKYINLLVLALTGIVMYSCSGEENISATDETGQETTLSVLLDASQDDLVKSSGNPDIDAEKKIYSLEVLIFKSAGEPEEGKLDGYGYIPRTTITVTGQTYDKEYVEINEIKDIKLTAGKRDIYVIANAPDKNFSSVQNIQEFLAKYEDLSTQGRYPHPGNVTPDPNEELPIGGINPSNLKTNLTMCNYTKNVVFNNLYEHHYLGYTDNSGRPTGVSPTEGWVLNGTNPFYVERLVARIAIQKIEFNLPASLPFEGATYPSSDYTYQIDTVFMLNTKINSRFAANSQLGFVEKFGHGNAAGYSYLNIPTRISTLNQSSQQANYMQEAITTPNYDISTNATPLWFYAFENESTYPTYLVIGVRYNFLSSKDNVAKTVKSYYPVMVNEPKTGKLADHDYIKRNYQYRITAIIKGLGKLYGGNPTILKSTQETDPGIEITEAVGKNLFPWTGDVYK